MKYTKEIYKFKSMIVAALVFIVFIFTIGNNNDQSWLVIQYPWGQVKVVDKAGWFLKVGSSFWKYPRNWQIEYDNDFSFKVVFNDGGSAVMNAMVRFSAPTTAEGKRKFHQLFAGSEEAIECAVWAHLSDAMKSSGPVMSASEHQSARRGEFTFLVQEQLQKGLFEMKKVSKTLQDQFDDKGKPITIYATEVVFEEGGVVPKISRTSPLSDFGITITQFSITDVSYDEQTQKQFAQKKEAFLSAEGSKAQREKEVQQRLMVEERGRREKAEAESIALKRKAEEVINAQREKEVQELNAQKEKNVAETISAMKLAIAKLAKEEAEVKSKQQLECAKLDKLKATEEGDGIMILASAKEKSLKLGGSISEREKVLAELQKETMIGVAAELAKIHVPQFIIGGEKGCIDQSMFNMIFLRHLGILPNLQNKMSE